MFIIKTILLFFLTAIFELLGCYLPYLWLRQNGSILLLIPTIISLAIFSYLLTLHPSASGRVYAGYGCIYVITALFWLKYVDKIPLSTTDIIGGIIALFGMLIIVSGYK